MKRFILGKVIIFIVVIVSISISQEIKGAFGYEFGQELSIENLPLDSFYSDSPDEQLDEQEGYKYFYVDIPIDPIFEIKTIRLYASPITKRIFGIQLIDYIKCSNQKLNIYHSLLKIVEDKYGSFERFSNRYTKTIGVVNIELDYSTDTGGCLCGTNGCLNIIPSVSLTYVNDVYNQRMLEESKIIQNQRLKELKELKDKTMSIF